MSRRLKSSPSLRGLHLPPAPSQNLVRSSLSDAEGEAMSLDLHTHACVSTPRRWLHSISGRREALAVLWKRLTFPMAPGPVWPQLSFRW